MRRTEPPRNHSVLFYATCQHLNPQRNCNTSVQAYHAWRSWRSRVFYTFTPQINCKNNVEIAVCWNLTAARVANNSTNLSKFFVVHPVPLFLCSLKFLLCLRLITWIEKSIWLPPCIHRCCHSCSSMPCWMLERTQPFSCIPNFSSIQLDTLRKPPGLYNSGMTLEMRLQVILWSSSQNVCCFAMKTISVADMSSKIVADGDFIHKIWFSYIP